VWNNNTITAQQIGMQAAHMWHEWVMVQSRLDTQTDPIQQHEVDRTQHQLQQPPAGYVKCNVDANFSNTVEGTC
jgi:hypothetical protein